MTKSAARLLGLAVHFGHSMELEENCSIFFQELQSLLNLTHIALWLNNSELPHLSLVAIFSASGFVSGEIDGIFSHVHSMSLPDGCNYLHVDPDDDDFDNYVVEEIENVAQMEIFQLKDLGIIKLFHSEFKKSSIDEINALNILFSRFAFTLQACIEHKKLQNETGRNLRLLSALNQSGEIFLILSPGGRIEYANDSFVKIYGYSRQEILGQPFEAILSYLPFKDRFVEIHQLILRHGKWSGKIKNTLKSGELRDFDLSVSPVIDSSGNLSAYTILMRDITKEVLFEEKMRQSQKLEAIGTLAGGIAHDFNNILFSIMGNLELCLGEPKEPQLFRQCISDAFKASQRAQDLVRQILLFSRDQKLKFSPLAMDEVVNEASRMLRATLPASIKLITQIDFRGHVNADITQLHQIVLNLGTNAFKAIDATGEIRLKLREPELYELELLKKENPNKIWICLEVQDDGMGIRPEIVDRVFDPFFTTRGPGEGTGLGLSMVHGIITRMGGVIRLDSKVGVGTRFMVFLPLCEGTQAAEDENLYNGRNRSARIMVVDDEKMVCKIYRLGLGKLGYKVTAFEDSEKALEEFTRNPDGYDLLVTDMMMPKLTGDKLAKAVLEIKKDFPIILCSGFLSELNEKELFQLGIKEYIEKPLIVSELDSVIRKLIF